jgi:hypothetical protein
MKKPPAEPGAGGGFSAVRMQVRSHSSAIDLICATALLAPIRCSLPLWWFALRRFVIATGWISQSLLSAVGPMR